MYKRWSEDYKEENKVVCNDIKYLSKPEQMAVLTFMRNNLRHSRNNEQRRTIKTKLNKRLVKKMCYKYIEQELFVQFLLLCLNFWLFVIQFLFIDVIYNIEENKKVVFFKVEQHNRRICLHPKFIAAKWLKLLSITNVQVFYIML